MDNCIFCRIVNKEIAADIVYEDDSVLVIDDISPKAPVHFLVIPKKHIRDLNEASAAETGLLFEAAKTVAGEKGIRQNGYRAVINCNEDGGQEVWHLHLHILGGRKLVWPPG